MAGASGGTRITTSVALVAIRTLLLDEDVNIAVQVMIIIFTSFFDMQLEPNTSVSHRL